MALEEDWAGWQPVGSEERRASSYRGKVGHGMAEVQRGAELGVDAPLGVLLQEGVSWVGVMQAPSLWGLPRELEAAAQGKPVQDRSWGGPPGEGAAGEEEGTSWCLVMENKEVGAPGSLGGERWGEGLDSGRRS